MLHLQPQVGPGQNHRTAHGKVFGQLGGDALVVKWAWDTWLNQHVCGSQDVRYTVALHPAQVLFIGCNPGLVSKGFGINSGSDEY